MIQPAMTRPGPSWINLAILLDREIRELDEEVVTLMRNHASTKAAGPAHTSAFLEKFARELIGPTWRRLLEAAA